MQLLPARTIAEVTGEHVEDVTMTDITEDNSNSSHGHGHGGHAYQEDEDDGNDGRPGVSCAQQ